MHASYSFWNLKNVTFSQHKLKLIVGCQVNWGQRQPCFQLDVVTDLVILAFLEPTDMDLFHKGLHLSCDVAGKNVNYTTCRLPTIQIIKTKI